jgi:hypothetical protein
MILRSALLLFNEKINQKNKFSSFQIISTEQHYGETLQTIANFRTVKLCEYKFVKEDE